MSRSSELRLPALEVRQGNQRLYQFAIDGKRLPDVTTVSRIHRDERGEVGGYQRPEVVNHVKAIRSYVEGADALMPNALVVAFDGRVRFEAAPGCAPDADSAAGTLVIPVEEDVPDEEKPGWIVDGQQRSAAIRDADVERFPVPVVAFVTDDLGAQRAQFILVNNTKPLPKGLIHELLPATYGDLPAALRRKRYPAKLLNALNYTPGSPMERSIKTPTTPEGRIKDNSVLKMLENSLTDGALYPFRDAETGEGDGSSMLELLWNFWSAVQQTWPDAWELAPRQSRLVHGVGIVALGFVMDDVTDRLTVDGQVPSVDVYRDELARIADLCAWTAGRWTFGPDHQRAWNELQVTPKDIRLLTDHLLTEYRLRAEPSAAAPRLQAVGG